MPYLLFLSNYYFVNLNLNPGLDERQVFVLILNTPFLILSNELHQTPNGFLRPYHSRPGTKPNTYKFIHSTFPSMECEPF